MTISYLHTMYFNHTTPTFFLQLRTDNPSPYTHTFCSTSVLCPFLPFLLITCWVLLVLPICPWVWDCHTVYQPYDQMWLWLGRVYIEHPCHHREDLWPSPYQSHESRSQVQRLEFKLQRQHLLCWTRCNVSGTSFYIGHLCFPLVEGDLHPLPCCDIVLGVPDMLTQRREKVD